MFPVATWPTFGANDVSGLVSPIGGFPGVGDGGYLIARYQGQEQDNRLIDVERWRIVSGFGETPLAAGGMMGATLSRRTGYAHVWEADVVLDLRVVPINVLKHALYAELIFRLPSAVAYSGVAPRYYWLPRAKIDSGSTILDAAGKKRVRQRISGSASCHLFLLPDDGNPEDGGATRAGAYRQWLGNHYQ